MYATTSNFRSINGSCAEISQHQPHLLGACLDTDMVYQRDMADAPANVVNNLLGLARQNSSVSQSCCAKTPTERNLDSEMKVSPTTSTATTPAHIYKRTTTTVLGKRLHREAGKSYEATLLSGCSEETTTEATNESSFYRNTDAWAANSCSSSEKQAKNIILIRRKSDDMRVDSPSNDVTGINLERNQSEVFEDSNNSLDYGSELYEE